MGQLTFDDRKKFKIGIMDLPVICVMEISEEEAKVRELPGFGEYMVVTHRRKGKRMRRKKGEEF